MNANRLASLFVLSLILVNTANAATFKSTYYGLTATTLGDGFSLTSDATGYTTAVTSADGGQTYQFDKYPVIHDFVQIYRGSDLATQNDSVYEVMHNKYGSIDITRYEYGNFGPDGVMIYMPMSISERGFKIPVNDFNIHGVVVGTNGGGAAATSQFGFLQNDFLSIPGVIFDSALMVDDSGQIIASGTIDGKPMDFLVTQGPPIPTPEPTTLVTLALGSVGVVVHRLMKRQRREPLAG